MNGRHGDCFFVAFTGVFSVLMAFVFWGTWSPDVAPVMPDDVIYHPLAFSDQFAGWFRGWLRRGVFVPLCLVFDGVCLSQYWTQELKYVAALYVSALGLAYFLRGRGLSRLASYGAGLFLGFCGYWSTLFSAGHAGFFIMSSSMVLALAFLDRAIMTGKWRHWILVGAAVGWGCCHQPDIFLLFALLLTAYGIHACIRERKFPWQGGLVALVFFAVVGAPGVRTAFTDALAGRDQQIAEEAKPLSNADKADPAEKKAADDEARWIFVTNWSMPPEDTLEFFIPRIHGDTSCPMTLQMGRAAKKDVKPYTGRLGRPLGAPAGNYRQHSLYVGWVTCLLALAGVVWGVCARRRDVLFFAAAALIFWVFSMGRFCEPVYRIVYHLPFGDYLRAPVKWHHLTEFCLCILAGCGIDALWGFLRSRGCGEKLAFALVAALVVFGAADLARIDRLYCAPIDLKVVRGPNAAADCVIKAGKGRVVDLIEGGRGLLAWSFLAHDVGVTGDPKEKGARFVWAGTQQINQNQQLANFLKARATPVGYYLVTGQGIRSTAPNGANAALYQLNGVPPPPPPARPSVNFGILALGLLSLAGTLAAAGCALSLVRK